MQYLSQRQFREVLFSIVLYLQTAEKYMHDSLIRSTSLSCSLSTCSITDFKPPRTLYGALGHTGCTHTNLTISWLQRRLSSLTLKAFVFSSTAHVLHSSVNFRVMTTGTVYFRSAEDLSKVVLHAVVIYGLRCINKELSRCQRGSYLF